MLENVPGHVIPILEREFDDFDTEARKYLGGGIEEDEFIKFASSRASTGSARRMCR